MQPYAQILDAIIPTVSFGYTTIHVFRSSELATQQVGYSVTPTGQSLIGEKEGDWFKNWLVIGCEDLCGDPIFIDTSQEGFPVYTAIHGEGTWDANQIADTLVGFGHALAAIAGLAKGRENPVALGSNPLRPQDKDAALKVLRQLNPNTDLSFWETVLS